ncbi:MAG TPA: PA14 domain-containing protein [Candidatus Aminicenantes bacterium]|nr:PA14 domain-containing protein [Candidatus Aminicenantes bacterium]HRY65292.1 PA14 domain-containing protein [Candidatus Aminicenantes bacterium]HRZ72240.1 PA14 domain-containing protein [Candidatus Aminicenantes bacterium]
MKKASVLIVAIVLAAGAIAACKSEPAAAWKPVAGKIMTRWAAEAGPANALPEYPRPQMVREKWLNLNGLWDYAIVDKDAPRPAKWDGRILVPFAAEAALSGVGRPVGAAKALWYRRAVDVPKDWRGGRVLLHFGAVDWESTVWVNGREVGSHRGGYDPFDFEIGGALKRGARQEIVVRVLDPTDEGNSGIARGKQVMKPHGIFYTAVTGIWQTVWIEPVPRAYIARLRTSPDIDQARLTVEPIVEGDQAGLTVIVSARRGGAEVASARCPAGQAAVLEIPSPALWSPSDPALYDLKVVLNDGVRAVDEVSSYAGMRKIAVAKDDRGFNRLFLNNSPLFEIGPLDQGWWPDGLYTAPTDTALRSDIEAIKALGMNMLRKHVKVEPDRLYYWCDTLGLLVWQDMPSALFKRDQMAAEALSARDAQFEGEWRAIMDALANHPAIVMWVPFNEGWGQYDTERIAARTREHDPSRLVNNASGWTDKGAGDVSDIHSYPGPDMPPVEDKRAAVLGEFGGLGLPVRGHVWQDEGNWGYRNFDDTRAYEARYVELFRGLYPLVDKGLAAAVYTQTSDCEIEVNGLMTYDREVIKLDPVRFAPVNRGFLPPRFVSDQALFVGPWFQVELAVRPGGTVRYTVDGSEPGPGSALYDKPIVITGETTVKARAFWPDGLASPVESRTFKPAEPIAASAAAPAAAGLTWESYEGHFDVLPDFAALTASRTGTSARPSAAAAGLKENFALRFRGYIRAPRTGIYVFYLASDDGSRMSIGGRTVVDNDGSHGLSTEKGEIALAAGWHAVEIVYFQGDGGQDLDLTWSGPGFPRRPVPATAFRR